MLRLGNVMLSPGNAAPRLYRRLNGAKKTPAAFPDSAGALRFIRAS